MNKPRDGFPSGELYHDPCQHKAYRLTCELFETVWSRGKGRCEICGHPEKDDFVGKLMIDHHAAKGQWAVRGLLCRVCNSRLCETNAFDDSARNYLEKPWYLSALAEIGLELNPPEPTGPVRITYCVWNQVGDAWFCGCRIHRNKYRSWRNLFHRFGPFSMTTDAWPAHPANR